MHQFKRASRRCLEHQDSCVDSYQMNAADSPTRASTDTHLIQCQLCF
jgi:hypothetical protein